VGASNEFSTPVDAVGHAGRTAVRTAVDGGEATVEGYYAPGVSVPYVVTDSTGYYRVETETVRSVSAPGYGYTVAVDSADSSRFDPPSSASFADLPQHDRDAVRDALGDASLVHAPHYPPFEVTFAYASVERRERSLFVPETDDQRVECDGELLRFAFEGERSVEVATVAVRAERVAASQREFRRVVGEERGRSIDDPTADQRAVFDAAIGSEYAESPRPSSTRSRRTGRSSRSSATTAAGTSRTSPGRTDSSGCFTRPAADAFAARVDPARQKDYSRHRARAE